MFKKIKLGLLVSVSSLVLLSACGGGGTATTSSGEKSVSMRLAHNQGTDHPVHKSLEEFTKLAKEESDNSLNVQVFPSGQLGQERDVIELIQSGTLDLAKVSASALESFEESYSIFSLPYVFKSQEHYYNVMDNSKSVQEIYNISKDKGFIALGWYDAGQRNIYTGDKEVKSPKDLEGMKIRVQESQTSIAMIKAMGGSPTPMAFGEVYTSLQQGIIDGAENNITALTVNKHGEVAKAYTLTEHQYVPDILIISTKTWDKLSDSQKDTLVNAVKESTESHKKVWADAVKSEEEAAKKLGVKMYEIDKEPFIKAAEPLHEEFVKKNDSYKKYFEDFQALNK
ncbi:TRAP transporter substrate-binding protein [Priestia flexa]|uniref:TRAP transporter substrate-binding protein n=1 Tax=Priestia flexa TaxID=86664 RepID=UPI001F4D1594|nr:TRAP transporter substrate-binding protein [Priestia flexa]